MKKSLIILSFIAVSLVAGSKKALLETEIPGNIKIYIGENFPGAKIIRAVEDLEFGDVKIVLDDGIEVRFDNNYRVKKAYKSKDKRYYKKAPKSIERYVERNFPGAKIVDIDYDDNEIEVELSNGIELEFDGKGKLLDIGN